MVGGKTARGEMNRTPPDIGDLIAMAVCLPLVLAWFLIESLYRRVR